MPRQVRNQHEVSTIKCAAPGCRNTPSGATDRWFVTLIERDVFYCRRYSASRPLRRFEQPAMRTSLRGSALRPVSLPRFAQGKLRRCKRQASPC